MPKRIEKINEKWARIPKEQLLNPSFNNQLNSIQILEQLAPLQLAKEHLPGDIIDILERLGKADHIPHNQLYYIAENCADSYYSKVIETFVALLKWQFTDRQLLLVNTARSLKFLEEYADRQVLIWQIFQKHENISDDIHDLHLHIDDFKTNIEKEFNFFKEATCKNIENFQTSLNLQQTYSAALCSHVNNIYHKISGAQQHTTVESAAVLTIQDKVKGKYDENIYSVNGQYRNELYNRAESMVPQLDGTYNVSDDSDTDSHSYLDLAGSNIIAYRT